MPWLTHGLLCDMHVPPHPPAYSQPVMWSTRVVPLACLSLALHMLCWLQVEIICASMSNALGTVGGFCVGDRTIVDHQRLSVRPKCRCALRMPHTCCPCLRACVRGASGAACLRLSCSGAN